MSTGLLIPSAAVRVRPVFNPRIGALFKELRTARGWSMRRAADIARRQKLAGLTRQVLLRLEKGQIKNPDPDVLRSVATLYGETYDRVVQLFVTERYGSDQIWQGTSVGSDPSDLGGSLDPTQTRDLAAAQRTKTAIDVAAVLIDVGLQLQDLGISLVSEQATDLDPPATVDHPRVRGVSRSVARVRKNKAS
jgi:transcriptional regulator with XRE-family HTH domain